MIKQATYDLLDASLRSANSGYLNSRYKDRLKSFSHFIRIDPDWSGQKAAHIPAFLSWSAPYRYADHPDFNSIIPTNDVGVYVMFVKPLAMLEDMPQYVMYIGISGEGGSLRPLKTRLMDYFYLSKIKLRSNVEMMLELYFGNVFIKYCITPNLTYQQLEELEMTLHEYYSPKFGRRDFEPATKSAKSAWGI